MAPEKFISECTNAPANALRDPHVNQHRKHPVRRGIDQSPPTNRTVVRMACSPSLIPVMAEAKPHPESARCRASARGRGPPPPLHASGSRPGSQSDRSARRATASRRAGRCPTQSMSAPASESRLGNTSRLRQASAAAAAKSQNRSRKKIPNMLATGRRSFRASSSGPDRLAGAAQEQKSPRSPSACPRYVFRKVVGPR